MDVTITNTHTEVIFIPGPNLHLAVGESKVWNDVRLHDLDAHTVIKAGVIAGELTITMVPDAEDALQLFADLGRAAASDPGFPPVFTVATLPTGVDGRIAFASDGRSGAEGPAAGTGVLVIYSDGDWRRPEDQAVVAA
jgi:hypothetical protein